MKRIYKIGTRQDFTYATIKFFKLNIKTEDHWIVRNVKYIFASNPEEAREKYEKWFYWDYKKITMGWGDWDARSNGVSVMMNENRINITSNTIVLIDECEDIDVNIETLKENMQAENFKEWWLSPTTETSTDRGAYEREKNSF